MKFYRPLHGKHKTAGWCVQNVKARHNGVLDTEDGEVPYPDMRNGPQNWLKSDGLRVMGRIKGAVWQSREVHSFRPISRGPTRCISKSCRRECRDWQPIWLSKPQKVFCEEPNPLHTVFTLKPWLMQLSYDCVRAAGYLETKLSDSVTSFEQFMNN